MMATTLSVSASIFLTGTLGSFTTLLLPLQTIEMFSVINIPKMPKILQQFYLNFGAAYFEFLPNIITALFPERITKSSDSEVQLEDNSKYHASLYGKLFLVNIGNTITLFTLFTVYVLLVKWLSLRFEMFKNLNGYSWTVLLLLTFVTFIKFTLTATVQLRYVKAFSFPLDLRNPKRLLHRFHDISSHYYDCFGIFYLLLLVLHLQEQRQIA
eukprot:TRINITY_DN5664_c0_g1_i1.p1 TRINITY_DN5664_c0_g1~~TRINITY_DN5664_c0_g1_i1.p1  ORF type:complete len:212 (-),score=-10.35 TRINITY_DN5664_c0_g1_i1:171-806(-)